MKITPLIPYRFHQIKVPMSVEDAEERLQIWSDPENGFASCMGGETPEGWILTRRPGLINNTMLVWGGCIFQ